MISPSIALLAIAIPSLSTLLWNTVAIVMAVLGIGFLIFIHELGHFVVAKWAGVKVEIFSLGFGPTLISWRKGFGFRRGSTAKDYTAKIEGAKDDATRDELLEKYGETEYSIRVLPLGGFVAMLGEGEDGDVSTSDPRAFANKPVSSRMAIMLAGVVMNLIFGIGCATWVHVRGKTYTPAIIGGVVAGQPAYEAGMRPGDEIVAIDGRDDISFEDITQTVPLSRAGHAIQFDLKRAGHEGLIRLGIEPRRVPNALGPTIGVIDARSLDLIGKPPKGLVSDEKQFDRILAAGPEGAAPTPVSRIDDLRTILSRERSRPLLLRVERGSSEEDRDKRPKTEVEVVVPPKPFRDFGMRMTTGPIAAVQPDSPASKAGFKVGDTIVAFDGIRDFDPMRLPDLAYDRAGKSIPIEIRREGEEKPRTIEVTPDATPTWADFPVPAEPLEIPGLGLAVTVEPKVAAVTPGSPAAKAGVVVGDVVKSVIFAKSRPEPGKKGEITWNKPLAIDGNAAAWPFIFEGIQEEEGPTRFEIVGKKEPIEIEAVAVPGWDDPTRGLAFNKQFRVHAPQPLGIALSKGWRDSREMAFSIFGVLRNLIFGRLGANAIGGPVMISNVAFQTAKYGGFSKFLQLMGLLSINLAVINLLPIPVLDGGRIVFLLAEKVRGRPLPEKAVLWPMVAGFIFIIGLIVVVSLKDVWNLF